MGKVKHMPRFESYERIPVVVEDYILSISDAMFITDIPLDEINEWAFNNHYELEQMMRKASTWS